MVSGSDATRGDFFSARKVVFLNEKTDDFRQPATIWGC
jgi:hypothetical protein